MKSSSLLLPVVYRGRFAALAAGLMLTGVLAACATTASSPAPGAGTPAASTATAASAAPSSDHRFCLMSRFEISEELSKDVALMAREPECELMDADGSPVRNERAMHLKVIVQWDFQTAAAETRSIEIPSLSGEFCLSRSRLMVDTCASDNALAGDLPPKVGMDAFIRNFKAHPFRGLVTRTFSTPIFSSELPETMWPLSITWPQIMAYDKFEATVTGDSRLTSPPLRLQNIIYVVVAAMDARDMPVPAECQIALLPPGDTDGKQATILNKDGQFAVAALRPAPGSRIEAFREGYNPVSLTVAPDGTLTGPADALVERIELNMYETIHLLILRQEVQRPRRAPPGSM